MILGSLGSPGQGVGVDQGPNKHLSDTKCNCYCHLHVHYIILTKFYQVISIFIFLISGSLGPPGQGGGVDQGPNKHLSDTKCNCYCHLHVHYIILTKFYQVISIFIFLILGSLGPPGQGVGVDQGPNKHLSDTKCNCYCHLHVHNIILTKFYQVINIFIFFILGVLCGRMRLGWGLMEATGLFGMVKSTNISILYTHIFLFYIPISLHL